MSTATTATYGAIPTPTTATWHSSSPSTLIPTPRSWHNFFSISALSRPISYDDAILRLRQNLTYFQFNYAAITLFIIFLSLIYHPISMIVFLILLVLWFFLYFSRNGPLVVFNRTLDDRFVLCGLGFVTVIGLVSTHVGVNVLLSLVVSVVVVALHGCFRVTEDLYVGEESGLLSVVGSQIPTSRMNYTRI